MFIVVLATILGLMHFYIWVRVIKNTTSPGRARWLLTTILLALTVLLFATLILPRVIGLTESAWFAWPGYVWFALAVYLFLTLLVLEPVRLALRGWVRRAPEPPAVEDPEPGVNRRLFLARASAVAAGVASAGLVGAGMASALGPPDLLRVPVRLRRLDPAFNGFRIAVVSDIHLGPLAGRAHTERIVEMINETAPDLVAIVGDLVDGTVEELGAAAEPLRDLVSRDGTFFVTGNHEYFVDDTTAWLRELDRLGIHTLRNENTLIRRGSAGFDLVGVNDVAGESIAEPPDFDRALVGTDRARPTVLLAHQPVQVAEAADRGVDLQLSGHTHGGQMWPFHYVVQAVQPSLAGLSNFGDTQLYVSRGAGFWGPPVRVGAPPDISVLTLQTD
ncbi:metallophosphoesterase [Mycolicibacterium wolinskyi]|uniref:Metallophosphatase n=1 Tax=Mycolicibacterium wolinskyi TaxID=59750 RepID=A0A1X2FB81_9MYCO|nr:MULTISPECIES: metallophosphoesterase [Mycolicibacterium]MCV7285672.1 metallophosphoesterase [Mycolicibacterium wolinskyi]MCV7291297.1 metallophosphoesterase [Mycolicibacterium goodii]ORX15598.1 metallophosphatase [Mycolicibacterium wolinskyi]